LIAAYSSIVTAALELARMPDGLLMATLGLAATGGVLLLAGLLLFARGKKRLHLEAAAGFLLLPPGLAASLLTAGDEVGLQVRWLPFAIILVGCGIALVLQAARIKSKSREWRNSNREEPM
jgi:hypothetical protein